LLLKLGVQKYEISSFSLNKSQGFNSVFVHFLAIIISEIGLNVNDSTLEHHSADSTYWVSKHISL